MKTRIIGIFLLCIMLSLTLTSCFPTEPPSLEDVTKRFEDNYKDIETVTSFLCDNDCLYIEISSSDATVWMDGYVVELKNTSVREAIERLMGEEGYTYICKNYNTITFTQWSNAYQSCGIACSVDKTYDPRTNYTAKMIPLEEKGWFYFFDDYKKWSENQADNEVKQEDKTII